MEARLEIAPLSAWWPGSSRPLLIAGPCSAETHEQVLATARQLAASGRVHYMRAGLWKPRTRPDSFEGVGEKGIPWLTEARADTGLRIITEVASPQHVELCLQHGFDALWIGARTTANPFSVQELAEALRGVNIPVLVKNPVNADLQLWIGALERFNRAGVRKLAALHRGFSYHGEMRYRNRPMWEIPIALKTLHPEIEIFCDPSHICGRRDLLLQVAQKALDLGMVGLMLEAHINPDEAWSDATQQVTPLRLDEMMSELLVRHSGLRDPLLADRLAQLRAEVDKVDEEIVQLISQRMKVVEQIGEYKAGHNLQAFDRERWREVFDTRSQWALEQGLSRDFISQYLQQLHKESLRIQTRVMKGEHKTQ